MSPADAIDSNSKNCQATGLMSRSSTTRGASVVVETTLVAELLPTTVRSLRRIVSATAVARAVAAILRDAIAGRMG
jgi:hypothetical protein